MLKSRNRRRAVASAVASLLSLVLLLTGAGGDAAAASTRSAGRTATASGSLPARPVARGVVPDVSRLLEGLGVTDLLSQLLQGSSPAPGQSAGGLAPAVASRVAASTVKVSGAACGYRVEGSGFSPATDTVVTNAHVVAGVNNPQVLRPDGRSLPGQVQVFDPGRDLAVLSVPGLGQQPLSMAPATVGGTGAVFGHPQGQVAIEASPARIARRVTVDLPNIYGQSPTPRELLVLLTQLEPGDSGGPLVDGSGNVVGVAFAVSTTRRATAFAVPSEDLAPVLGRPRTGPVSTGPCLAA